MEQPTPEPWHALDTDAVLDALDSQREGLDSADARERLTRHGPNALPGPKRRGAVRRFVDQFANLLILILVVAAVVTALFDHLLDAIVIAAVVLINTLVGFIQEGKAEKALDAIRSLLTPRAHVLRDGRVRDIDATGLVPGDIVRLESGDRVPADLRLLSVHNLQVDESMLTGESVPVTKHTAVNDEGAGIGDRLSLAYAGTMVRTGRADGVVVATGIRTELGRISELLGDLQALKTPLLLAIERFARILSVVIVGAAVAIYLFGLFVHDYSASEMFIAAVALAVAAIPEGLPAIITITLALGVQAMARRNAIVRRLPAVEALGAVTVICSDKTGTLTRNEMRVSEVDVAIEDEDAVVRCMVLCNDAEVDGTGDPTETALLRWALERGTGSVALRGEYPRTGQIPFESEHRFMATAHDGFTLMKGAPEAVLAHCQGLDMDDWQRRVEALAGAGRRTLALADRQGDLDEDDCGDGWRLLAVVGLMDPPRDEAITSIAACHAAGIRVKMVTGDHALTAVAIGNLLGIGDGTRVLTGDALTGLRSEDFTRLARETDVFARVSPEHKLRLVEALQDSGEVVAMTGDGVNDAPALKRASVGVAMGRKGTEAAREAAEIVLADDNFASIEAAVAEGRRIYDNIKKAILFILPTNAGEALTVAMAILLGRSLPLTPVQVLWVNMVTAVTLALALVFEPAERDVMKRPPRPPDEPILSRLLVQRTLFVGVLMLMATFGLFAFERAAGASLESARTVAVNALVMCEIFYLLNSRYLSEALTPFNAFRGNPWVLPAILTVVALQLLLTYAPPLQSLFGTTAIGAEEWLRVVGAGVALMLIVEAEKALRRR